MHEKKTRPVPVPLTLNLSHILTSNKSVPFTMPPLCANMISLKLTTFIC